MVAELTELKGIVMQKKKKSYLSNQKNIEHVYKCEVLLPNKDTRCVIALTLGLESPGKV